MSSRLLHLKSESKLDENLQKIDKNNVFVTSELTSLLLLRDIYKKDSESCLVIQEEEINFKKKIHEFERKHLLVRSDEVVKEIEAVWPKISTERFYNEALFYKDQEFKSFNGRAKPHKLLAFESYFIDKPLVINMNEVVDDLDLRSDQIKGTILSIKKKDDSWLLLLSNHIEIKTKNLFWGKSRKDFYDLLDTESKECLSSEELAIITGVEEYSLLNIYLELDEVIKNESQTLFIPQSQTYDYGHYILDFHKPDPIKKTQNISVNIVIHNRDADEEELGEKIKKMKRKVSRIFPNFSKSIKSEEINLFRNILCSFSGKEELSLGKNLPRFIGNQSICMNPEASFIGNAFKSYEYYKNS